MKLVQTYQPYLNFSRGSAKHSTGPGQETVTSDLGQANGFFKQASRFENLPKSRFFCNFPVDQKRWLVIFNRRLINHYLFNIGSGRQIKHGVNQ